MKEEVRYGGVRTRRRKTGKNGERETWLEERKRGRTERGEGVKREKEDRERKMEGETEDRERGCMREKKI